MSQPQRVVVFDLDVTLTRYDTFLPFVIGYVRYQRKRRGLSLWRLPFRLLQFWHWGNRTWMKTEVLKAFLGGQPRERIESWAERFTTGLMDEAMRAQGLEELRRHQHEGARVILASASFDIYVRRLAEKLGIEEVLASRIAWNKRDRLAGMDGENCRDHEKLRRLKALLGKPYDGERGENVTAYSDSHADLPLLTWAENGVAVCPSKRLFHQVGGLGLEVARWQLGQARDEPILVTDIVLCEMEWVLDAVYAVPKTQIARTVRGLLVADSFAFRDHEATTRAVARYDNSRGDLSDYLLGENAAYDGASTIYTFDKGLKQQPGFTVRQISRASIGNEHR